MLIEVPLSRSIIFNKDFFALIDLYKKLRKLSPDIVHLHSSKAGALGRILSFLYSKPKYFYSPHGYSFLQQDIPLIYRNIFKLIEFALSKLSKSTIIASGKSEFQIAKSLSNKVVLVNNGIDTNFISRLRRNKAITNFTVGTLGRITTQKNPKLFNEIALLNPEVDFKWIGDGESKKALYSENIRVTGWQSLEKAIDEINDIDVYLHTSSWEGLPLSILYAISLNKVVLATNSIGNKDIIENGKNGFLFETLQEANEKLQVLINDYSLKESFTKNAYQTLINEYNIQNYDRLYYY